VNLYILDTDSYSNLRKSDGRVARRVLEIGDSATIAICVITKIEQLEGRFQQFNGADSAERLLHAASQLRIAELRLASIRTITINEEVAANFDSFRNHKTARKMKRRDFLIGCIVLAHNAILVTRNTKDFELMPGLKFENWAD